MAIFRIEPGGKRILPLVSVPIFSVSSSFATLGSTWAVNRLNYVCSDGIVVQSVLRLRYSGILLLYGLQQGTDLLHCSVRS